MACLWVGDFFLGRVLATSHSDWRPGQWILNCLCLPSTGNEAFKVGLVGRPSERRNNSIAASRAGPASVRRQLGALCGSWVVGRES